MELTNKELIFLILVTSATAATLNSEKHPQIPDATVQNKTIDKLIQEQTNFIKQIVAGSRPSSIEYPIITKPKLNQADEAKLKMQKEQESIEQLRNKCHELAKIDNEPETDKPTKNVDKITTVEAFGPSIKPQFLDKSSQTSELKELVPDQLMINDDEIQIPLESKAVTISSDFHRYLTQSNVQYVEFEPFVLQKIVLATGQELFYWYKKYPTMPQFVSVAQQQLSELNQQLSEKPTAVEKEKIPNYEIEYNPTEKIDNNLYRKEMKFVLPMTNLPKAPTSEVLRHDTSNFDPYAYYPKQLQPSTVHLTVPYVPTYHMLKTITLPDQAQESDTQ